MQTGQTVRLKFLVSVLFLAILCFAGYSYRNKMIFNSITVDVKDDRVVEFGTTSYDSIAMLSNVSGDISILKDVNTNKLGEQVVLFEIEKSNVKKHVPVSIKVVDSVKPVIELSKDTIYINVGKSYDILSNIKSVTDNVDGKLEFKNSNEVTDEDINYYTVIGSVNTNKTGKYSIEVKAIDKANNISLKKFNVIVTSHGRENSIKSIAYSLLGKPYVYGGSSINGFDCSGFVQYVYARNGLRVGRSATDQLYNGYEVSYKNARVGDIIVWGYGTNSITHTGIYVGDGLMIHASNPKDGVVVNKVANWGSYTGVHIVSVRRLS